MSDLSIPLSINLTVDWPEQDFTTLGDLPVSSFSPIIYNATIELLVGEKVHSYKFHTVRGEVVIRDATLGEWKLGQRYKEAAQ